MTTTKDNVKVYTGKIPTLRRKPPTGLSKRGVTKIAMSLKPGQWVYAKDCDTDASSGTLRSEMSRVKRLRHAYGDIVHVGVRATNDGLVIYCEAMK